MEREVMGERTHRYRGAPPRLIFRALTDHRRAWVNLHPGEVMPEVVEAVDDRRVVWSSLWPVSIDDTIEMTLIPDRGDTLLTFRWFTATAPDERGVGITRQRLNRQFGANIRGWLADPSAWPAASSPDQ